MRNPFARKKSQDQLVENQFRTQLVAEARVDESGYDAASVRARASFERIVAQPRDELQSELVVHRSAAGRVVHSRRVRFAFAFVFVLVGIGGGVNILLHQGGKKEDILTRAQAEYGDKQGIVYVRGKTVRYSTRVDTFGNQKDSKHSVDHPVELWGTSDGLYAREVLAPRWKRDPSGAERLEFLETPDGSCYTSSKHPGFATYIPVRQRPGRMQADARSCPIGLGLRPRVHIGSRKARVYEERRENSRLPVSVSEAVLQTGKLLRRILAGKFQRHTVEGITERGRPAYRVKAWRPAIVYESLGKKEISKIDFTVETFILDKKTLHLMRYEERTNYHNKSGFGIRSSSVYSFILDQPPRFYPETKANYHLLRTQFAPSRVDYDPFSKDDLAEQKKIYDAAALRFMKPWIKEFEKIHHRRPSDNEIDRELERRRRASDAFTKFREQQYKNITKRGKAQREADKAIERFRKQQQRAAKRALER